MRSKNIRHVLFIPLLLPSLAADTWKNFLVIVKFFWVQLQKGEEKRKAKSGVDFRGGTSEDVQTPPQHYDWVQDIIWSLN